MPGRAQSGRALLPWVPPAKRQQSRADSESPPRGGEVGNREWKPKTRRLSDPTARAQPHLRLGHHGSGVRDRQLSACGSSNSLTTPTALQIPAARGSERMDATKGRGIRVGKDTAPSTHRQWDQVFQNRWKTCTLARVLTHSYRPREPWGTQPANHHMEAVPRAPNWLSTDNFASHWHVFRSQLRLFRLNPRPTLRHCFSAEEVGSRIRNAYACPQFLVRELGLSV